jgi:methylated-DNA-[protein]-cysteine S-methyltransferase
MHPAIQLLKKIPKGKVATYKEMARVCKTSPRAIGRIMAGNQHPVDYPCYKVVASSGELTGYSAPGGVAKKHSLLQRDGVGFIGNRVDKKYFHQFILESDI